MEHIQVSEVHRAFLPIESYAVTSGLRGGIAGGIVMIFPALLYGYLAQHSIWYAVNLLGGRALRTGQTRQLPTSQPFTGMG